MFSSGFRIIMVLSWNFKGLTRSSGSGITDFFRLIDAARVESSTNVTCIEQFFDIGLGRGGLRQAPLNFTIKRRPPSQTPWPNPPGRLLGDDTSFLYFRIMDLEDRYEHTMAKSQFGVCIACKSSTTSM